MFSYHRGEIEYARGHLAWARTHLTRALEINPYSPFAEAVRAHALLAATAWPCGALGCEALGHEA
ncbi:hypothetical protein GCM10027203_05150 [Nonomuraea fastidiosa]